MARDPDKRGPDKRGLTVQKVSAKETLSLGVNCMDNNNSILAKKVHWSLAGHPEEL